MAKRKLTDFWGPRAGGGADDGPPPQRQTLPDTVLLSDSDSDAADPISPFPDELEAAHDPTLAPFLRPVAPPIVGLERIGLHQAPRSVPEALLRRRLTGFMPKLHAMAAGVSAYRVSPASARAQPLSSVLSAAFDREGLLLAAASAAGVALFHSDEIRVADVHARRGEGGALPPANTSLRRFPEPIVTLSSAKRASCVAWNPRNQNHIAAGHSGHSAVAVFDINSTSPRPLHRLVASASLLDARYVGDVGLMGADVRGTVGVWDPRAGTRQQWITEAPKLATPTPPARDVHGMQPSWVAEPGSRPPPAGAAAHCIAPGPHPSQFLAGYGSGVVRLFDTRHMRTRAFGHKSTPGVVAAIDLRAALSLVNAGVAALLAGSAWIHAVTQGGVVVRLPAADPTTVSCVAPCVKSLVEPNAAVPRHAACAVPALGCIAVASATSACVGMVGTPRDTLEVLGRVRLPWAPRCVATHPSSHQLAVGGEPGLVMVGPHDVPEPPEPEPEPVVAAPPIASGFIPALVFSRRGRSVTNL